MELWIRSQDKEELVKVDNIRIKHEYEQKKVNDNYGRTCAYINGKYKCSYIYADSIWLGEYKTKERALEVLDEIQSLIDFMVCKEIFTYDSEEFMQLTYKQIQHIKGNGCIYEMPKE